MNQNRNKFLLLLSVVLFWFAQYVYIPFQTPYLTALGISSSIVGIVVGAYGISQMLLRIPVGVLADSGGTHKKLILIGCLSAGTASLLRILVDGQVGYLIANLFSGLASAMWISFMVLYMSYFSKEEQQAATSHLVLWDNVGILIGFTVSTLLYNIVGMKIICLFSVIGGILAFLCAAGVTEQAPVRTERPAVTSLLSICFNRRLLLFGFLALIQQGVQMATTMSFTTQIVRSLGASSMVVGMASIIYMISAVSCSKLASTTYCTRRGPRFWVPAVFLMITLYCVLVPQLDSVAMICCLQILPGFSTGILYSYLTSEAMAEVPQEKKSTAMGTFQAVYALGMTTFPILAGRVASAASMTMAYFTLAGICLFAAVLSVIVYRVMKKS